MNLKELNKGSLELVINGVRGWTFSNVINFDYHVTNYSKIILHNVIHRDMLRDGLHFDNHSYLNGTETFSIATLESNGRPFFTGIINSSGRYSLKPTSIKDKSIEIVDIRWWLSKKTPADVIFYKVAPQRAVLDFIEALAEPRIKPGKLSFSNNSLITAYDTTSKTPYNVLKDIIAMQARSFLYFSQDNLGNLLINFDSEQDFKDKEAQTITPHNWNEFNLIDLVVEENNDDYFNVIRNESANIIANSPTQEYFNLSNNLKSIFINEPIEKIINNDEDYKTYFFYLDKPDEKHFLEVVAKQDYSNGKNYHLYYEKGKTELVLNPEWNKENIGIYISYFSKTKQAITIENNEEINRIHNLNTFKGDVFRYTTNNDISTFSDLYKQAEGQLERNSKPRKELKLTTIKPFLNLGDVLILDYKLPNIDGRYITTSFSGTYNSAINELKINYHLRNGMNADTLINFFESSNYKINPYFEEDIKEVYKYKDKSIFYKWRNKYKKQNEKHSLNLINDGKLITLIPYHHKKIINLEEVQQITNESYRSIIYQEE